MTDRYENIRRALAIGVAPTPGPWSVRYDYVVQAKSFDEGRLVPIAQPYGLRMDGGDLFANAALIAACDPDTIRALLEERDALQAENERLHEQLRLALREASPAAPEADLSSDERVAALCDLSYRAGLKAGWNYCTDGDQAGFARSMESARGAVAVLAAHRKQGGEE